MTLPPITPLDADLEGHLVAERDATIEQLLELVRIPSVSALPQHADDMVTAAEWIAGQLRRLGADDVEVVRTALHPIVTGGSTARRVRRPPSSTATTTSSPSTRSTCGSTPPFEPFVRDGRMVGRGTSDDKGQILMHLAAIEALQACRGDCRSTSRSSSRARRSTAPRACTRGSTAPRSARREPRGHQRHGLLRGQPADDDGRPARDRVRPDRCRRIAGRPPLGRLRRRGREPGERARHDHRALKGPDGRIRVPGFYDEVRPLSDAEREAMAALPFDEEALPRRARRPGARRRAGLHRPRAHAAPGRRSTSTASGAASRAMAPRRSSRPTRTPSSRAGWCPTRIRTGSSGSATTSSRSRRPASTVDGHRTPRRQAVADADRPPATQAAARALEADVRRRAPLQPRGRLDPGGASVRSHPRSAGRAARLLAAQRERPRAQRVAGARQLRGGIRTIIRFWDELAGLDRRARRGRGYGGLPRCTAPPPDRYLRAAVRAEAGATMQPLTRVRPGEVSPA